MRPSATHVGSAPVGTEREFTIELANQADRPIRIIGGTNHCSCIAIADLPVTIQARETQAIKVFIKFRGLPGRFRHDFVLLTDDHAHPKVSAAVYGRVQPAP